MSDAKQRILANVRRGLGRQAPPSAERAEAARQSAYASSPAQHPRWDDATLERLLDRHEAQAGTWKRVAGIQDVPGAVSEYMTTANVPDRLQLAPHPLLNGLSWPENIEIVPGTKQDAESRVAVSVAEMGMAETGTLVLYSGPASPTRLALLPEFHIVVLSVSNVVDYMEEVWQRMRERGDFPPRSVNFITGPSRTADVEQTIQLGAHGPRALHLILVD